MALASKTFRIFVSSTFSDLKEERNALQKEVFPKLRDLCMQNGYRFQAIDLRWGVREESALDQQTMNICLDEVARCQKPPNPNFIVLLGDRYGWQPLPVEIPATEYEQIDRQVSNEEDKALLRKWYKRDDNAVPAVYCLQPREVDVKKNATDIEKKTAQDEERILWNKKTEPSIRKILRNAIKNISLTEEQKIKYISSATEQEIVAGALNVLDAKEHVFGFFRQIEKDITQKESAKDYIDLIPKGEDWQLDNDAQKKLEELKKKLSNKSGKDNIFEYNAEWKGNSVSTAHIPKLCDDVYDNLSRIIEKEISLIQDKSPLEQEIDAHEEFGKDRAKVFVGRVEILNQIQTYISGADKQPLAVYGESGTGKSTLMAYSLQQTQEKYPNAEVLTRFIGVTPDSSDGRALLESLCRQISKSYGTDKSDIPADYKELIEEFPKRLYLATAEKPLIIYLDALDQLSDVDNSRNLTWLPTELPENVRLLVSTLPGECYDALNGKIPEENIRELQPMPSSEGEELLDLWLKDAKRTLQANQRKEILSNFNCEGNGKPLYLKIAFEESSRWKSYTKKIKLNPDIRGVIHDLFIRLSKDENHGEMMVSRCLGYIAAGKNGLSEDELLDVLATDQELYGWFLKNSYHIPSDVMEFLKKYIKKHEKIDLSQNDKEEKEISDKQAEEWFNNEIKEDKNWLTTFLTSAYKESQFFHLPIVLWSRLYFDLEPYLTERSADGASLLAFYHSTTFGAMVEDKYLSGRTKIQRHRIIAEYFDNQSLYIEGDDKKTPNLRKLSELPYQQTYSNIWKDLYNTLTDTEFLKQKNTHFSVHELLDDFQRTLERMPQEDEVGEKRSVLNEFKNALDQASFVLKENPELTFPQIYNRLQWQFENNILLKNKLEFEKSRFKQSWLHLITRPVGISALMRTFAGHTNAVNACTFSSDGSRIVSVSEDKNVIQWNTETGEKLNVLKSVEFCNFSPDGRRIVYGVGNKNLILWNAEKKKEIISLKNYTSEVYASALSPEGRRFVSVNKDKTLRLWDVKSGEEIATLSGHTKRVHACAFSPNGKLIASGDRDGILRLWDANTGKKLAILKGHTSGVFACAFSPDGRSIISGSSDKTLKLWDVETVEEIATLSGHTESVQTCTFNPNGKLIASGGNDGILILWDAKTGEKLNILKGHTGGVYTCCFGPNGNHIVSGGEDKTIRLWNAETGEKLNILKGHTESIENCGFSSDNKRIFSSGGDKTLRIWNIETGEESTTYYCVEFSTFSQNYKHIFYGSWDETLGQWDVETGTDLPALKGQTGGLYYINFSSNSKYVFSISRYKTLRLWNAETGEQLATKIFYNSFLEGHTGFVQAWALSPNGNQIVSASWDKTLRLWDVKSGEEIATLSGHTSGVIACAFSPDGIRIISISRDKTIRLWNAETRKELAVLKGHTGLVESFNFSPNNRYIASCSGDKTLQLWNAETGEKLALLKGHTSKVNACAFSPDGKRIISGSVDKTLILWNVKTGEKLALFKGHTSGVFACAFSPDGRRIVSGSRDKTLKLWDVVDIGEEVITHKNHTRCVRNCAFSPDGSHIISCSEDKTLKLWDVKSGEEKATFPSHTKRVNACAFSPDGKHIILGFYLSPDGNQIVSASGVKSLRLWDAETGKELNTIIHDNYITLSPSWGTNIIYSYAFSPDGRRIVSANWNDTLSIFDVETGEVLSTLTGHTSRVHACAFSPDGRRIVSGSRDKTLKLWDAKTGVILTTLRGHNGLVRSCTFSSDGKYIVSGSMDKTLKLWNSETGSKLATLKGHTGSIYSCTFSPDDRFIVVGDDLGQVLLISIENVDHFTTIVTPMRIKIFDNKMGKYNWADNIKTTCQKCGKRFPVSDKLLDAIKDINRGENLSSTQSPCFNLSEEAWDDPRLLSECPHCYKPLRFNPFVVDNKKQAELPKSKEIFIQEPEINSEDADVHFSIGVKFWNEGQIEEAMKEYKEAIRINPNHASAHSNLGLTYQKKDRIEEALYEFREAIRIDKNIIEPHNNLGAVLWFDGKLEEAIEEYKIAIQIKEDCALSHYGLGMIYKKQGNTTAARFHLKRALELGDERVRPHLDSLKPEIKSEDVEVHYNLGYKYWIDGKIEEAIKEYKKAIRINPNHAIAHNNLGMAYRKQGLTSEAIFEYREAIRIDKKFATAHNNLGAAFWNENQIEEAIEEYKIAIRIKEDHTEAHFNIGLAYKKLGITAEAKYHFKRAFELGFERARRFLDDLE